MSTYVIRVEGRLDDHWSAWLGGLGADLDMARDDDGSTTVTVSVADQAQLHGILTRSRDLGTPLLALRALDHVGTAATLSSGPHPGPTGWRRS